MDSYTVISLVALLGFALLAFIVLAPVYFFLKREERTSREWTHEAMARRRRREPPANGKGSEEEESEP